jgi:hypothetical protein
MHHMTDAYRLHPTLLTHLECELGWEGGDGQQVCQRGHDDGGDDELHLEGVLNLTDGLGGGNVGGQEGGGDADDDADSAAGGTPQQEGRMLAWPNKAGMTGMLHGRCQFDTMTSCAVITSTWDSILSKLPPNCYY